MAEVLTKAASFVAIIILGYLLRRCGFFKEEDFHILSRIVLKITLPAAIVTNFAGTALAPSMLFLSLLGLGCGIVYICLGLLVGRRGGRDEQAFCALNIAGYNIGNFTMPFAQSFLGPAGVIATSLFDAGNSFICLGGACSIARMTKEGSGKFSVMPILRALSHSVPFVTYILMVVLSLLHISLPAPVLSFAGIVSNANAFIAMLMIGVGFKLSGDKSQLGTIVRILTVRYGTALLFALCFFFLLPIDLEYRQTLALLVFSPIASAAPAFTADLKSDFGLSSAVNSISIVISIVLITATLIMVL